MKEQPYPITAEKVMVFLEYYRTSHHSTFFQHLKNFVSALRYKIKKENLPDPTKTQEFSNYLTVLMRAMHNQYCPNAKKGVTANQMQFSNKEDVEIMAICSTLYYGFFRVSEGIALKRNDIEVLPLTLNIRIRCSKTDQAERSETVVIHNSNTNYSPFVWLIRHSNSNSLREEDNIFKQSSVTFRRKISEIFQVLFPEANLSTHSFRKGAATEAARHGIPDYYLIAMGRWRSNCYQIYTAITMRDAAIKITTCI